MSTNYTDQKFFYLTLIEPTINKKRGAIIWKAMCDCGNIVYDTPYLIKSGYRKSCGCIRAKRKPNYKTTAKDWAGQKFNRLILIKPTDKRRGSFIVWLAQCDCGTELEVCPTEVASGNTTSCGCYQKEMASKTAKIMGEKTRKYSPIVSSARVVWGNYKDCDFETFFTYSQKDCYYCGRAPHRIYNVAGKPSSTYNSSNQLDNGNFIYNGLDRLNSNKNHTIDNIVPCCLDCNIAKNDQSLSDFFNLIKLIFNKHLAPI